MPVVCGQSPISPITSWVNKMDMLKDDYTKQYSISRVSVALVLTMLLIYAGYQLYKTATLPDLPNGWLTYLLGQYGLTKGASTIAEVKVGSNAS